MVFRRRVSRVFRVFRLSRVFRVFRVRPHGHNVAAMCASLQARRCPMGASASVCNAQITCLKTAKHMYELFVAQMHHLETSSILKLHWIYNLQVSAQLTVKITF